jgi:hypothetical protein
VTYAKRNFDEIKYQQWRRVIRRRDGHKCQWANCGAKKNLKCHHIRKWADYPTLRYDVNNGITLCREHHDSIHGREEFYVTMFLNILLRNKINGKEVQPKKKGRRKTGD